MRITIGFAIFLRLCLALGANAAETAQPNAQPAAAPSARVGRISLLAGTAEFRGPGEAAWSPAAINDPVATGVTIRAGTQAGVELRIGADAVMLDRSTELSVVRLETSLARFALRQGRIAVVIPRRADGETVEVDLRQGAVLLLEPGQYDIAAGGEPPARIAVLAGAARFTGGGSEIPIVAGTRVAIAAAGPLPPASAAAGEDEFWRWCAGRAVDDSRLVAPYFVSREMTGYDALDAAGSWHALAGYGEVWSPQALPADWAPYRQGHWRYLAPWGWTWVDDRPWGFAPSHYGRWLNADGKWVWVPGRLTTNPVWAPAMVAFLGTPGVGLSYAGGSGPAAAWFPLAPREVFWPSYSNDLGYIRAINRGSVADLVSIRTAENGEPAGEIAGSHYANRAFASAVPRAVFVGGQAVATALVDIPSERLRDAPVIIGAAVTGPPAPAEAHIAAAHERPQSASAASGRSSTWANTVRAAAMRSQRYQKLARLHFLRPARPQAARSRHDLVLRVARADHAVARSEASRRVFVRW